MSQKIDRFNYFASIRIQGFINETEQIANGRNGRLDKLYTETQRRFTEWF